MKTITEDNWADFDLEIACCESNKERSEVRKEWGQNLLDNARIETMREITDSFYQRQVKYTIAIDWLQFVLTGQDNLVEYDIPLPEYLYGLGRIRFNQLPLGTKFYKYGYEVFIDGKKYAKVFVKPRKEGIVKSDCMQFEIVNNVLYEVGFLDTFKYLLKTMKWNVRNITRLDIALDGKGFFEVWKKYERGEIQRKGISKEQIFSKSEIKSLQSETDEKVFRVNKKGERKLTGFDIGSRASDKWITCYGKSDLLKNKEQNKKYIHDYWERSGLDTQHVERMELKLRNESIKMIDGFFVKDKDGNSICDGWKRLDDFEFLASIFRTFVDGGYKVNTKTGEVKEQRGLFVFVVPDSQQNISRKEKYDFIDWESIGAKKLDRLSTEEATEVWAMKLAAKRLIFLAESCKKYESNCDTEVDKKIEEKKYKEKAKQFESDAYDIAANINCITWMQEHYDEWTKEYAKRNYKYLPKFKSSKVNC